MYILGYEEALEGEAALQIGGLFPMNYKCCLTCGPRELHAHLVEVGRLGGDLPDVGLVDADERILLEFPVAVVSWGALVFEFEVEHFRVRLLNLFHKFCISFCSFDTGKKLCVKFC